MAYDEVIGLFVISVALPKPRYNLDFDEGRIEVLDIKGGYDYFRHVALTVGIKSARK